MFTMSHELRQFLPRFCEKFGDTSVAMDLKGNTSSLDGWKCSRLIYLKIC